MSSVMEGYEAYREQAREAIQAAGARALQVEDQPSLDTSPRNACLALVDACDVFLLLVAGRGGWTAPSGLKVTEEEFHHARSSGKPILVFLEEGDRDPDAARLAQAASDYTQGRLRRTYGNPEELGREVHRALDELIPALRSPLRNPSEVQAALLSFDRTQDDVILRVCSGPQAQGELLDVLRFDDEALHQEIYRMGHDPAVGIFSYEEPKEANVAREALTIIQGRDRGDRKYSRVTVTTSGLMLVDTNVTGRTRQDPIRDMGTVLVLLEDDVLQGVRRALKATAALYDLFDPHRRHERVLLNAALAGVGYRTWQREAVRRQTYGMRMSDGYELAAFSEPKLVARQEITDSDTLGSRIVGLLRREVESDR
ncbi:MAG TPA: DUF4062 domain-containing protein [Longimicrobiales bacterium]|nr:DUF4062 domain-containing protein [Longimicrobiales bacterium]